MLALPCHPRPRPTALQPPNCAQSCQLALTEGRDGLERRISEFLGWLMRREERLIVLVGHSLFHKAFMGKDGRHLRNAEFSLIYK